MESDNAVIALSWRRSSEVRNPSKREQKKNPFPWRFACIMSAAWEGQIHILNFIYSSSRRLAAVPRSVSKETHALPVFPDYKVSRLQKYCSDPILLRD